MKRVILTAIVLLFCFLLAGAAWYYTKLKKGISPTEHRISVREANRLLRTRLSIQAKLLLAYTRQHGFNTNFCFLVDMSIESGSNRFFVYDLKKDSILEAGLVTHGRCNKNWLSGRQYGNDIGCGCTSLGKYKIGNPYKGKFGLAYKLSGLDATNNNAFKRFVVLHSHSCVPNDEVTPAPICQSDGCPTVSVQFLTKLATYIDQSKKPVLLTIFDQNK